MDNPIETYLFLLPAGTMVEITYNQGGGQVKTVTGSILHMDQTHSMVVLQTPSGLPQMLNTSLVLGFTPVGNEAAPAPAPAPTPAPAPAAKPAAPAAV